MRYISRCGAQPVMPMLLQMYSSTHYAKVLETEGILGNFSPIFFRYGERAFKSRVSEARTLQLPKGAENVVFVLKDLCS